ncbi:MAG TPA: hypothetical protein VGQ22_15475 [Steroidobacteraceae bacterium]|nr:hypothetical protein [Steroidobacteraceae bacterium]
MTQYLDSEMFGQECRARWAQAGELRSGSNCGGRAITRRHDVAARAEERLSGGCQQVDGGSAALTSMMLDALDQSLSETMSALCGCHNQRAQQRVSTEKLYANDPNGRGRRTDIEKVLHVVIREIGRRERCALQKSNDFRATRRLMDCRHILHG